MSWKMIVYWNPSGLYTAKDSVDDRLYRSDVEAFNRLDELQAQHTERLTIVESD